MSEALVSCIMPVFNGRRFITEALDSIFAQTYQPIEVIVVDDGSTDDTADVVTAYGRGVRLLQQANAGAPAARNHGIRESSGSFLAFLDSDDKWPPHKLAAQLARFEARPELGVVAALAQNFWEQELAAEQDRYRNLPRGQAIAGYVSSALLVRRGTFDRVGLFNPSLRHGDSADWFLRARELGIPEELVEDVLLLRRMHGGNMTRSSPQRSHDEFLNIIKRKLDRSRGAEKPDNSNP